MNIKEYLNINEYLVISKKYKVELYNEVWIGEKVSRLDSFPSLMKIPEVFI